MTMQNLDQTFLDKIFPAGRADEFFDALFGGAEEGAYDIGLVCRSVEPQKAKLAFELRQRPGKCLACNLTYGLPQVFTRHPLLAVGKLAQTLAERIDAGMASWALGSTREISRSLHVIPFTIKVA